MNPSVSSEAFRSAERERQADAFGMWIFIASEAMLFGAVLLVYLVARLAHGEAFAEAAGHLSLPLGTVNTAVLIASSFFMALAHIFTAGHKGRPAAWSLIVTAILGTAFLAIKASEYAMEHAEGLAPVFGAPFRYHGPAPAQAELFFNLYFAMTGLHALHLLSGILAVLVILLLWRSSDNARRMRRVQAIGLYWHFIDIVWVFLFPVLYLIDR
ncbi:MAG: cytochrome c oxidase subunit 3 [Zhengella sp.]|uniref:cytochrome c oxidase subunit 3 n=1 Tax=Zhengella sp. TaxID=2282762 RepID=UPI00352727FD